MVAAAVHTAVSPDRIESVQGLGFARSAAEPSLRSTATLVGNAIGTLPQQPTGPIVAERGEFYDEPAWSVAGHLDVEADFKYVETIAHRKTVEAAHHAAYAARTLLL